MKKLPLGRLRIKVRSQGETETYKVDDVPQEFRPYVQQAIVELGQAEDPTIAKLYYPGEDRMVHIWYKPVWKTIRGKNTRMWP